MRPALFLFALSLYLLSMNGTLGIDEETMYLVTESIAERGTVAVGTAMLRRTWTTPGHDGRTYSYIEVGQSVLALPFYYIGRAARPLAPESLRPHVTRATTALLGPVSGAAAVVLLSLLVEALGHPPRVGVGVALLAGLGTTLWPYARTFYREPVLAALLLAVVWAIVRHRRSGAVGWVWLAGAAFFLACTVRVLLLGLTPFLLIPLLRSNRARAGCAVFALFALAALGVDLGYNALRFGSPFRTGYPPDETFSHPLLEGLYGFLFSPGRGLLCFCPVMLLSVVGLPRMWKERREALYLIAVVSAFHLCVYACWWAWADHMGLWGARYLVPMIPLAIVPAAWVKPGKAWMALFALSIAIQTMGVLTWGRFLSNEEKEAAKTELKVFDPSYSPILSADGWLSIAHLRWDRAFTAEALQDPHSDAAHELRDTTARTWWAIAWRAGLPATVLLPAVALVALLLASGAALAWRCR